MENTVGEQGLDLQQLFPNKSSHNFFLIFQIQTIIKSRSFMPEPRGLKFGTIDIFNIFFFPTLAFFNVCLAAKGFERHVMCSKLLTYTFLGCFIIPVAPVTHTSVRPGQILTHSISTDIVICHTFIFI